MIVKVYLRGNKEVIEAPNEIDIIIFKLIAMGDGSGLYTDKGAVKIKAFSTNEVSTSKTSISNSINRLKDKGLIHSPQRGQWTLEDPSFRDYLLEVENSNRFPI